MEKLCSQGHVIDNGLELCSRCGGAAVNTEVVVAPEVVDNKVDKEKETASKVKAKVQSKKEKVVKEKKVAKVAKKVVAKGKKK